MKNLNLPRLFAAIIISGSLLFLHSCLDPGWDFERFSDEIVLSPGVAAPLAYGSLSLADILNEVDSSDYVKEFEDNLLYITYAEGLFSYPANEVVNIPNQSFLEFFIESEIGLAPEWIGSGPGDTVRFQKNKDGVFMFENNEKIDSIHVKTMDLVIDVHSSFEHKGILTITSENILVDGEPFREVIQISDAFGNFNYTRTIPIDGHSVYLDNSNPDTTFLPLRFDLALINSGNPILPSQSCDISMTFVDPEFYAVFGYFGDYNLILSDGDVTIDFFDTESLDGQLLFADPRFVLDVANSYGLPVEVDITNLQSYSKINNSYTDISFNPGLNPFSIGAPGIDRIGDTVYTQIEIDRNNCNILEAMETSPSNFLYSVAASTNPQGPGAEQNFVTDSSNLDVNFEVTLPIWIKADGFILDDTLDFNFEEQFGTDASKIIDYFRLTMDATNEMPMRVNMQLFFADENYQILDSMFVDDDFLLPPSLNDEDMVENPAEQSKSVEFDKDRLEAIQPSKYMIIRAKVNTAGASSGEYVKFYSYYTVDFKLKMKADLTINSRDL